MPGQARGGAGVASQSGLVVILDDIHVGDERSLLVLRHLAEQIANAKLLVFATFRDVEPAMGANTAVSESPSSACANDCPLWGEGRNMDASFRELTWVWEGGMKCDTFRRAVEAFDLDATVATFSPSIVLRSPVREEPLEGREAVGRLFAILFRVFEDLRFVGSFTSGDGAEVLHFLWRLGDAEGEGVDMMRFDGYGLIEDYRVMVRPLSAVVALRDAAFSQLPEGS